MDNFFKLIIISILYLIYPSLSHSVEWTKTGIDSSGRATYMRTPQYLSVQALLAKVGSTTGTPLQSSAPNTNGGKYLSPVTTTISSPKIATNVKIPVSNIAGVTVAATLTAVVSKSGMAKAGIALLRANPYVSTALTVAWLANSGYQYLSATDTFETASETGPIMTCQNAGGVGADWYYNSGSSYTHYYITPSAPAGNTTAFNNQCVSEGAEFSSYCNQISQGYSSSGSPTYYWPKLCRKQNLSTIPKITKTLEQAETALSTTPITGTVDTPTTINDELGELIKADYIPQTEGTPQLRGPNGETSTTTPGPEETITESDQSVANRRLEYQSRFADDRAEVEEMLGITNRNAAGDITSSSVTTRSPDVSYYTTNEQVRSEPTKTDCDKYPDSVGCSKYGTVVAPETLPITAVSISLSPTSLGAGSCPSSQVLNLQGQPDITLSYQPYCDFAIKVSPLVISFAWLSAGLLVLGSVRE